MEAVYKLWDELHGFAAGRTDEALVHLAKGLVELLKADNVRWMAAICVLKGAQAQRDSLLGWRARASYNLIPDPASYEELCAWWFKRHNKIDSDFQIGLATHANIAEAGTFRVHQLRDGWIPYTEFRRSDHYRLHYTELGITDRLWVTMPINADSESVFLVDRTRKPHFSAKEVSLLTTLLRGIPGFHRQLLLSRGLGIANAPLSPVAERIVSKLLTGMSEKEIAASMGQTLNTTHKYIKSIYEQFGVKSRAGLMSIWLGQQQ